MRKRRGVGTKYREEEKGVEKANVKGEKRKRNKRERDEGNSKRRDGRHRGQWVIQTASCG